MPGQRFNEIGAGIVPGAPVFATGVAQSYYQLDCSQRGCRLQRGN